VRHVRLTLFFVQLARLATAAAQKSMMWYHL
jgi:hypothetical protein